MNLDNVIAGYLREYSRRRMHFPPEPSQISLPQPDAGRRYLLYLHIPFCKSLCPFCSFHRVLFRQEVAVDFFAALRREIDCVGKLGFEFDELYIGGGTPTVLPGELRRTIDFVGERHPLKSVSVETNPDDLVESVFGELVAAGVNRVSVGVQSLDDDLLDAMHRRKPYGDGQTIIERLQGTEGVFDTLNVDMIFNIPNQTEDSLARDLEILTSEIGVDQVSFYPLMTLNSARERMFDAMGKVDYSREEALYRLIVDRMNAAGYDRASVWCFSQRPGMFDEYIAERDEYLGLGSGAFSYIDGSLFANTFSISQYLSLVGSGTSGIVGELKLNSRDRMRYFLLLRLFSGTLEKADAEARFADRFQRTLWPEISLLQALGAVADRGERLELTERGSYLWVVLMREFFTGVNNLRDQMRHLASVDPG